MNLSTALILFVSVSVAFGASLGINGTDTDIDQWAGRIVGGSVAGSGQFPHQASLQNAGGGHFCGGSIINTRAVLSAAHCTINRSPGSVVVRVGTTSRTSGGVVHGVAAIRNHPSFNGQRLSNDISIVIISGSFSFNNLVRSIPIATVNHGVTGAQVSGWGQTSHPGSAPVSLMWISTQTLTLPDCRARHTAASAANVHDHTICTFLRAGHGTCMGDSGGPLIAGGQVIGIVSWGTPCAVGRPDVFTRVFSFRTWIQQNW